LGCSKMMTFHDVDIMANEPSSILIKPHQNRHLYSRNDSTDRERQPLRTDRQLGEVLAQAIEQTARTVLERASQEPTTKIEDITLLNLVQMQELWKINVKSVCELKGAHVCYVTYRDSLTACPSLHSLDSAAKAMPSLSRPWNCC
jgi:hypothetical protein